MNLRISPRERQYLDYLKQVKPSEYRGSWQQVIRHIIYTNMIADSQKDDHPFKFTPEENSDNSNSDSDTDADSDSDSNM